jgi:hypothetical protein
MRRYARSLAPVIALVTVLTALTSPLLAAKEPKTVKIGITCKGGSQPASASVKPETVTVEQDQNIIWKLKINNSNRNDLTIEPKEAGKWPFEADKHTGQGEVKTVKMKPDAAGDYLYKIRYKCDDTDYLIDPRVRVGGGGGG